MSEASSCVISLDFSRLINSKDDVWVERLSPIARVQRASPRWLDGSLQGAVREGCRQPGGVLGGAGGGRNRVVREVEPRFRVASAVREVVCGREGERRPQLP